MAPQSLKSIRHINIVAYPGRRIIQANPAQFDEAKSLFQNKAPLRPIKACKVLKRYQVGLVSMVSMPATIDGDTLQVHYVSN